MNNRIPKTIVGLFAALLLAMLTYGCATPKRTQSGLELVRIESLEENIDRLIDDLFSNHRFSPGKLSPVAVMPGSLRAGNAFTRLEELVMERLSLRLHQDNDVYSLSRQNWFEFREGRPLTFGNSGSTPEKPLRNLSIYEVTVSADRILEKLKVRITASDMNGRMLPGVVSGATLDYDQNSPAYVLYGSAPLTNPFPEGLEENPYTSIDRLTYSLASELADVYRAGISADGELPADQDVRVMLFSKPSHTGGADSLVMSIQDSLQQAVVGNRGFTCSVSKEDFGPAFQQIDFYEQNYQVFEVDESRFTAGTVLLMAENFQHRDGDKIGVALRAIWRVSPLETRTGELIPTNVAGTYISGFTAKAYLSLDDLDRRRAKYYKRPLINKASGNTKPANTRRMNPGGIDVCFQEFTEVLEKRIYPVLNQAPGVSEIRRIDPLCEDLPGCVCYKVWYRGPIEELEAYLTRRLRTSQVLPFRMVQSGDNCLELRFDGGFN